MIASSSECHKSPTTTVFVLVMAIIAITASNSDMNQDWLFAFCLYFLIGIKLSIPERIHSEMREGVLADKILLEFGIPQ